LSWLLPPPALNQSDTCWETLGAWVATGGALAGAVSLAVGCAAGLAPWDVAAPQAAVASAAAMRMPPSAVFLIMIPQWAGYFFIFLVD
jgi:hypothetical protein